MTKRKPFAVRIIHIKRIPDALVQLETVQVRLTKDLLDAACIRIGEVIGFTLEDDLLSLECLEGRTKIKRNENAGYVRRTGAQGAISISRNKMPKIFEYNIPNKITDIDYEVVDNKMVINLSNYRKPVIVGGFAAITPEPIAEPVVKRGGFEILRELKA